MMISPVFNISDLEETSFGPTRRFTVVRKAWTTLIFTGANGMFTVESAFPGEINLLSPLEPEDENRRDSGRLTETKNQSSSRGAST